jgi:hypothetical protein
MSVCLHNIIIHTAGHYQYLNTADSHAKLKPTVADCAGSSAWNYYSRSGKGHMQSQNMFQILCYSLLQNIET